MDAIFRLLMICLLMWLCACYPKVCSPKIGCMHGKYMSGYETEKFEAFIGIPYALPPINKLRFRSPRRAPRFNEVYLATNIKSDCIQKNYLMPDHLVSGDEDCLYLNVYRPLICESQGLLPVMVYIHGGGFFTGTGSPLINGPEYLMDTKEVIVVTLNYRLGSFGFLSTNDKHMPGNYGLKDQNLALYWVQNNIEYFGGNRKKVTIFGQSAGAVSVHMHMLSKQSEDLFHYVIALSGTANVPFAITENPLAQARELAKYCNITDYETLSTEKLMLEFQKLDALTLINAADNLKFWDVDPLTDFRPVVENASIKDAFLTQHPTEILANGNYKSVPWMVSFVPNEGAVRAVAILESPKLKSSFNDDFDNLLEKLLDLPKSFTSDKISTTMSKVIETYFNGNHHIDEQNGMGLIDVITDRGFRGPMYDAIETYVNVIDTTKYPLYLVKFNYQGNNTYVNFYMGGEPQQDYGVVHCNDLAYLFRSPSLFPDFPKNSIDADAMRAFVKNFVHFAKNGTPQNVEALRPCNKESLKPDDYKICDYQEFRGQGNTGSFEVRISNQFSPVTFWRNILAQSSP